METELEKYEKVGKIAAKVRQHAEGLVKENASLLEIAKSIEKKISELGAKPAFPVNISINEIAAHYSPKYNDTSVLKKGDLVKIDFGVHIDGYPADTAFSASVGKNEENEKLIMASRAALDAAISAVKPGVKVSDIGKKIEAAAKQSNLQVIKNLSGHGVKRYDLHTEPSRPNFDNNDSTELEEDKLIAIEPFITSGKGFVIEGEQCEIYMLRHYAPMRDREILDFIRKEYSTLPFAKRWLVEKFGQMKVSLFLKEAVSRNILHPYHVLKEVSGAKIAQTEHTILVAKNVKILTAQKD
jgi:methionyl aminopeptidase